MMLSPRPMGTAVRLFIACVLSALWSAPAVALPPPAPPIPVAEGAQAPCGACIAAVVTPAQALALPVRLPAGLLVLVAVPAGEQERARPALADIRGRGGRAGLLVHGLSEGTPAVAEAAQVIVLDVRGDRTHGDPDALAFALKTALTRLRAAAASAELALAVERDLVQPLLERDLGSYVDFIAHAPDPAATVNAPVRPDAPVTATWHITGAPALRDVLAATRQEAGARWLWTMPAAGDEAAAALRDLAVAAEMLPSGLVTGSQVAVRCGANAAEAFLNPASLETVAVGLCDPESPVTATPPEEGMVRRMLSTGESLVRVPAPGAPDRFASGVEVTGARQLTVEEVIARHQAAAARQAAAILTSISEGTLTLSFEAPGFPAPITISSSTTTYTGGGRTELEQRRIRVNGIEFAGGGVPRLPIVEPERVAATPLSITLTDVYRYRLVDRTDVRVEGRQVLCYVVEFEPVPRDRTLYTGRAWIAADDFGMVKVEAAQTSLRGPIVSSEQSDEYRRTSDGWWLLARSDVRQIYEGAAHRTPIHRVLAVASYAINPPDFSTRLQAAYASNAVMLRDTPEGFRYLRREVPPAAAGAAVAPDIEPVVAGRATRVRTLAAGVIIDPNITTPLPFAGLSYVDFNLLGTGAQVNAFFGGTYGQLAFSVPSLGGTRWQLAGRAFGIASSYNDRSFANGRERYGENIRQRPAHASVWLLRPLTPRISIRAGYDLDYTRFSAADVTAPEFVVPAHQVAHGARLTVEGQRRGWNIALWWNPVVRSGWRAWGRPAEADYSPSHGAFQRYGISVVRAAVLAPRLTSRVEAAAVAGRDLDRFSRYSFGTFDNRLRGYPSALIRYDRGAVVRGALAWSAGRLLRADFFLDSAQVRDPGFGPGFRNYTGLGAALEAPAPFGMLVAAEWGYGLRGVNADGGTGTQVVRISAFKVF